MKKWGNLERFSQHPCFLFLLFFAGISFVPYRVLCLPCQNISPKSQNSPSLPYHIKPLFLSRTNFPDLAHNHPNFFYLFIFFPDFSNNTQTLLQCRSSRVCEKGPSVVGWAVISLPVSERWVRRCGCGSRPCVVLFYSGKTGGRRGEPLEDERVGAEGGEHAVEMVGGDGELVEEDAHLSPSLHFTANLALLIFNDFVLFFFMNLVWSSVFSI